MDHDGPRDLLRQIPPGTRIGGNLEDEAERFYVCKAGGQAVDLRDLSKMFTHEEPGHPAGKPVVSVALTT